MTRARRSAAVLVVLLQILPSVAAAQASKAGVVTTLEGQVTVASARAPQPRPLKFKDDKKYVDRLKASRAKTGRDDCMVAAFGEIG